MAKLTLKERNQKFKSGKVNIEFSIFGKILGYNPSLLSMLIFEKEFQLLIKTQKFFEEIEEVWYSIPNEGSVIWFDMMGIPADAKNVDNAHKFIDYILRPEVIAEITNYVWYSNPNLVANTTEGLIDPEILEDPAIYPTEETLLKLFADTADSPQKSRISSRVFNSFKAAQ